MKLHPIPIEPCPALRDAMGPDGDLIYAIQYREFVSRGAGPGR